ncbi:Protein of unknown function [Gryllus bimaculatus]|nr:Protein of unknown function [Gryllus bimaculatus]
MNDKRRRASGKCDVTGLPRGLTRSPLLSAARRSASASARRAGPRARRPPLLAFYTNRSGAHVLRVWMEPAAVVVDAVAFGVMLPMEPRSSAVREVW